MYPPDDLLTLDDDKHVELLDPDPFLLDCLDDFPPSDQDQQLTKSAELNMNTSEDEPSSGLNGRLRPRKSSSIPIPQNKVKSKTDGKAQDRPKRTSTPSKALPNKQDDLTTKSDFSPTPQFLCPYCDRKFASRQTMSKHIRRIHLPTSKPDVTLGCLFCNHSDADAGIMGHMVDSHPNQYFACLDCHTRFSSTSELAEHKLNVCEKQKLSYRTKLRPKPRGKKLKKPLNIARKDDIKEFQDGHGFNGIVISCELKPPQDHDAADIEDNITTNLILPSSKSLGNNSVLEKNAVIVLDDLHWNKRIPPNFTFHNADPDQILSRLGVVHRSPRTGESTKKDWFKLMDESTQKFERCFDTKFYSKVASNVQENMTKFLDGSCNFNPDPESTIKTRKTKNNVVINTAEGFPILLASEQYSRSALDGYQPRAIAPKHKWKWENLENDRSVLDPDQIKRDSHTNNCIITLVSRLDIWTQLSMRRKFEEIYNYNLPVAKKTEKQNTISKELKEILESREIPTTSQVVRYTNKPASVPPPAVASDSGAGFPAALGLMPSAPACLLEPAVLSGEWVRPRCYMCCACGEQTTDSKGLSSHIAMSHPNAHVQYYEIVGEKLLNSDILKYLYVPPSQVSNRTRLPRGFKECTKCNKSVTLEELHQHMLDCAGDSPAVRRRQCRHRPFGVRRRRPRISESTIRKKIRKDIRQRRQKSHIRPRPRIRTEVGDAETIRKMIADLPAKRHRVLVNPVTMIPRSRLRLDRQRNTLIINKRSLEDIKRRNRNCINKPSSSGFKIKSEDKGVRSACVSSPDDDDEDNKPLKPKDDNKTSQPKDEKIPLKPKLKSIINKNRQRDSLKRQTAVAAAKKKSIRVRKMRAVENVETIDKSVDASTSTEAEASSSAPIEEVSVDKPPQRLDVKKASYNKRERSNRGASGNRDGNGQRPGASRANGAGNQPCDPAQNVPLKHSIARLTANSETHDKSVQFHHLFLVQQECNNTDQHVPSGQPPLFENEAVVTKLDKPPLNYCQKGFLDMQSLQKSKLNKPRKGLNDCIAMLKNKLVEPEPFETTGHVSVQCGSDEPIDTETSVTMATTVRDATQINVQTECHLISVDPEPLPEVVHDFTQQAEEARKQTTSKISAVASHEAKTKLIKTGISLITAKATDARTEIGVTKKSPNPREANLNTDVSIPALKCYETNLDPADSKPIELHIMKARSPRPANVGISEKILSPIEVIPPKYIEEEVIFTAPKSTKNIIAKTSPIATAIANTPPMPTETSVNIGVSDVSSKPIENIFTISPRPTETNSNTRYDTSRRIEPSSVKNISPRGRVSIDSNPQTLDVAKELYKPQVIERLYNEYDVNRTSKISPSEEHRLSWTNQPDKATRIDKQKEQQHSSTDIQIEHDLNSLNPGNVFGASRIMDIPPAHSSTKIDSIIAGPLDLSSKVSTRPSNLDCSYAIRYENYETLDLSKKNLVLRMPETFIPEDVVVDLRVKPTQVETLNLCVKTSSNNNYHSANMTENVLTAMNYPTDLSLKGKDINTVQLPGPSQDTVKDFSVSKPVFVDSGRLTSSQFSTVVSPTDLSEKNVIPASHTYSGNNGSSASLTNSVLECPARGVPDDLTRNLRSNKICEHVKLSNHNEPVSRIEKHPMKASQDKYSSHIPKPLYDPTLKIPQYKLRDTTPPSETCSSGELLEATAPTSRITQEMFSKTPSGFHNTSQVFGNISRGALSGGVVLQTVPCPAMTSTNRVESTIPVYTLANACIPVTKIESTQSTQFTSALLSIPGSTMMNTAPVYTLTSTTIGGPSASTNTDFFNGSASGQTYHMSAIFNPESLSQPITRTPSKAAQNMSHKNDIADQDLDTARKIAMLPKELVDIIGNVPVDQRKQLLNILPQYVSTPKEARLVETAPVLSTMFSNRDEHHIRQKINAPNIDKKPVITYVTSEDLISGTDKIQQPKQDLGSAEVLQSPKKNLTVTPVLEKSSLKPPINLISRPHFNDCIQIQDKIIDLTTDEVVSPVSKASGSSCSITISTQETIPVLASANAPAVVTAKLNISTQKSDSKKTASLRAVRIKAPSERQKENKVMTKGSVEQVEIQKTPEPAKNEARNSSDTINALAIQQAEISSTQHSKLCRIESNTKSMAVSNNSEKMKLEPNTKSPITMKTGTGKDHAPDNSGSSTLIKSNEIRSGLHTNTSECIISREETYNKLYDGKSADTDMTSVKMNLDGEGEPKLLTDKSEINTTDTKISESDKQCLNQQIHQQSPNDDDSEDDLVLASIVKQKLTAHKSDKDAKQIKPTINRRKKKGKKYKKNAVSALTANILSKNANQSRERAQTNKTVVKQVNQDKLCIEKYSFENNNAKTKLDQEESLNTDDFKKNEKLLVNSEYSEVFIDPQNTKKVQELTTYSKQNENITVAPERYDAKSVKDCVVVKEPAAKQSVETVLKKQEAPKTHDPKQSKNAAVKDKSKRRKKPKSTSIDTQEETSIETQGTNVTRKSLASQDNQDLNDNKTNNSNSAISKELKYDKTEEMIEDQVLLELDSGQKLNKKEDRSKNITIDVVISEPVCELSPISKEAEENLNPPLRRSRRGKSLFVEGNNVPERDNVITDTDIDHKAPLTKKQLIFSKMLHDEEIHNRTRSLSPEKEVNKNITDDNVSNINQPLVSQEIKLPPPEITSATSKSSKRKQTMQLKTKYKKKKSIDCTDVSEISIHTDSSQSSDKMILSQSFEPTDPSNAFENTQVTRQYGKCDNSLQELTKKQHNKEELLTVVTENKEIQSVQIQTPTEKRKICKTPSTVVLETDEISKPKKAKLYKNNESPLPVHSGSGPDDIDNICQANKKAEDIICRNENEFKKYLDHDNENKVTTCYDVLIAARRTRSKSVVVKSSTAEFYDPYDIDLDEMIQKVEPLRKSPIKQTKVKVKDSHKISDFKAPEQKDTAVDLVVTKTDDILKQNLKRNKLERLSFEGKNEYDSKHTKSKETKYKKVKSDKLSTIQNKSRHQTQKVKKDNNSDSDDSSKSDIIPLKKYVEEKTLKKVEPVDIKPEHKEEIETSHSKRHKKNRRSSVACGSSTNVVELAVESEEQSRSEQFMESFGFFSERKPRKSNLLAAKKISETFHIIANESDDSYLDSTERVTKRTSHSDNKKLSVADKKSLKKVTKKKIPEVFLTTNCDVCKKVFRRPDNYIRHLLSSTHLVKLAKQELNLTVLIGPQRPNCLLLLRERLHRTKKLHHKLEKKSCDIETTHIVIPTMREMIVEVFKKARILHHSRHRGLSRDEALFLDCCEMLKESHKPGVVTQEMSLMSSHACQLAMPIEEATEEDEEANKKYLEFLTAYIEGRDTNEVDPITAKTIMESEEVRKLENDLISGLKEAYKNAECNQVSTLAPTEISSETFLPTNDDNFESDKINESVCSKAEPESQDTRKSKKDMEVKEQMLLDSEDLHKNKKYPEFKEKMYPDIEEIDMFEDKFDKIKRKCRSQAAAAKQNIQTISESISGGSKGRKKSDKKKPRKTSKKSSQNTVLTKGALKGFDGIKVSIPTSDIKLSAIAPSKEGAHKKKRKTSSKKKRDKKDSESCSRYDSDPRFKDSSQSQKKVDVYEFMDNEDAELFEFRPSTLMERFKIISNKETLSTSKRNTTTEEVGNSSVSGSDGDDFVYMSDDYVCSDDETENSLLSCELSATTGKTDVKKVSPLKRKDAVEKNAVMGKIFKHNAVRSEKKFVKIKDSVKPKANLDQLFDSLLEEKPNTALSGTDSDIHKRDNESFAVVLPTSSPQHEISKSYDRLTPPHTVAKRLSVSPDRIKKLPSPDRSDNLFSSKTELKRDLSPNEYEIPKRYTYEPRPSTSKSIDIYGPSTSKAFDTIAAGSKKYEAPPFAKDEEVAESLMNKFSEFEFSAELDDDAGVARQRARRKCTVGKQNVLAETWSSESEPDGVPARPNSAESVVAGAGRKKKGKKKDSLHSSGRRTKVAISKKQDLESRVSCSSRTATTSGAAGSGEGDGGSGGGSGRASPAAPAPAPAPPSPVAGPSGLCPGSGWKPRPRPATYYWAAEDDDEQEHQPQHGWIVGDSHKKLVTMLAHAKGRKRNSNDKRHFIE